MQGTWRIVEGNAAGTTPAVPLARPASGADEQAAWDEKNDKALGIIEVYLGADYKHYVGDRTESAAVWKLLKDDFGKPGAVGAFVAFEEMFDVKMVDTEPLRPQISKIEQARTAVTTAGITIRTSLLLSLSFALSHCPTPPLAPPSSPPPRSPRSSRPT